LSQLKVFMPSAV